MNMTQSRSTLWWSCGLVVSLVGSVLAADHHVGPSSPEIHCIGRFDRSTPNSFRFWFPGSKMEVTFSGTKLVALLNDEKGENFFNIIVDGDEGNLKTIRLDPGENQVVLLETASRETHRVELFKLTEFSQGYTDFKGLGIDEGGVLTKCSKKKPLIEYYGDSVTCGLGSTDMQKKEDGALHNRNHYVTYAAVAARELGANHICIARSGVGFSVSWFNLIMPELYDRLDPTDPSSRWDFNTTRPDLVVVNVGQNDSGVTTRPNHPEYIRRFGEQEVTARLLVDRYKAFIRQLIVVHPDTPIICALGSTTATRPGSPWPGYIEKACTELKQDDPTLKIHSLMFPFKGSGGHPITHEHKAMAEILATFIRENKLL